MVRRRWSVWCAVWVLHGMCIPLRAHDIPNARVDRAIQVILRPGRLEVDYEVSLADLTLAQDLKSLIGRMPPEIGTRLELYDRYARETGPLNARGFLVSVDGYPLDLICDGHDLVVEEHPRFTYHLSAPLPERGKLAILDTNYAASEGTSRLALRSVDGVEVPKFTGPFEVSEVPERPVWMLSDEEERRTKQVEVDFLPAALIGTPPVPEGPGRQVEPGWTQGAVPGGLAPAGSSSTPQVSRTQPPRWLGLGDLLDGRPGVSFLTLCVIAFGLGAAHAVQPGHGKTLVAAASLGEGGAWWRGALLAVITTLAHTSGVVVVAAVLWLTRANRYGAINAGLLGVAGFLIAAVGLWRVGRHLGGHGEHGKLPPPESSFEITGTPTRADGVRGLRGLLGLGLAGGLVPCWDAVILILIADALGRLPLGLALLAAFSAGMAAVLVLVGIVMARVGGMFAHGDRWERRLGLLSGSVLAVIGLLMLARA